MIHPDTELRFAGRDVGHGVFATKAIPAGTLTWARDRLDREFDHAEVAAFDPEHRAILDHFSYRNSRGHYMFCWDHARFMNHSFRPTCLLTPYGVEIAVRDIAAGDELTIDYGCLNIIEPFTPRDEGCRRREVRPDDLRRHFREWDRLIGAALRRLTRVGQPLRSLLEPETWSELQEVSAGAKPAVSIVSLYCGPPDGCPHARP